MTPRPPFAAHIWCDDRHIYIEHPCPDGKVPHISEHALSEAGLWKALATVRQLYNKSRPAVAPGRAKVVPPPTAKITKFEPKGRRAAPVMSDALSAAVARVLKRNGVGS